MIKCTLEIPEVQQKVKIILQSRINWFSGQYGQGQSLRYDAEKAEVKMPCYSLKNDTRQNKINLHFTNSSIIHM